jgi:methyltransferase (TIGR00027 family)
MFRDDLAKMLAEPEGFQLLERYGGGGLVEFIAIRTCYLDRVIQSAVTVDSMSQVVLLASGMDTRSFRLHLPSSVTIYEVDYSALQVEKEQRFKDSGARPLANRRTVRADLTEDWVEPLKSSGWDSAVSTLWIVEGLTFFLTKPDVQALLNKIRDNSAQGSRIGVDIVSSSLLKNPFAQRFLKYLEEDGTPWKFGTDTPDEFLRECGWEVTELCQPGEEGVGENRWPYPVHSRDLRHAPRHWLMQASLMA